jgi:hypothetical protein
MCVVTNKAAFKIFCLLSAFEQAQEVSIVHHEAYRGSRTWQMGAADSIGNATNTDQDIVQRSQKTERCE